MAASRYPVIAREGWLAVALIVVADVVAYRMVGLSLAIPVTILLLIVLFMFRDPRRKIPPSPLGVVSPADGKIVALDKISSPYGLNGREMHRISIQMSPSGVFSLRSPMEGKVIEQWFFQGEEGEVERHEPYVRYAHWVQSDEQDDVIITIGNPPAARHPHCEIQSGERIGQGQRCGYIFWGTRVDLLLPVSSRIEVKLGSKVKSGSDIVATLIH